MTGATGIEQFAEDYLLVVMNDQSSYNYLKELYKENEGDSYSIAVTIQEEYEEAMRDLIGAGDSIDILLARQLLLSWGIEPFMVIARSLVAQFMEESVHAL